MITKLDYGKDGINIELPDKITTIIEPTFLPGIPDRIGAIKNAIRNPIGTLPLKKLVKPNQTVGISVCDITRPMPTSTVLPVLLKELEHIPNEQITIFIATGTHRANTASELDLMLGINIRNKYNIINHDAFNEKDLELAGKTSNNIPIWLNKKWINNDIKITTGFVEPHFFAGFSGGPKMIAPGLAGFKTIMGLHSSKMISNPNSTWGITFGNPIHDSIREIAKINKVDFSIDVSINRDHQITSIYAGELFTIHKACSDFVKHISMKPLSKRFPIILTSNSGYPLDLNLYQAVKGISAAAQVVEEKGSILCVAECKDGIPSHGKFKQILESRDTPEGLLEMINSDKYESHDQWQVQILAQIMTKANISFMSENIKDQDIISAHMNPITNLEKTLDEKIKEYGKGSEILVLPQGPQTIPYIYN